MDGRPVMESCLLLLAFILFTGAAFEGVCGQYENEATAEVEPGVTNHISLYSALYNAIIGGMERFGESSTVSERFIINIPGKVLNPVDYEHGQAFEHELSDPKVNQPEVNIPLHIKENIFRLTDTLPQYNPWEGSTSGRSFLSTYMEVIEDMDTASFDQMEEDEIRNYQQAITILNEMRSDPDTLFMRDVSRLDLYNRYKVQYYQKKTSVAEHIAEKKATLQFPEYEEWAQDNLPALEAEVEAAYSKWLVYGEKAYLETGIGYLDTSAATQELELARVKLKAALLQSASVNFRITRINTQPPLWYKYLYPKISPLTKEQIAIKIGYIESAIETQKSLHAQSVDTADIQYHISDLKSNVNNARVQLQKDVSELDRLHLKCRQQHADHISQRERDLVSVEHEYCTKYLLQEEKTRKSQKNFAITYTLLERSVLEYDDQKSLKDLKATTDRLTTEVTRLRNQQKHAPSFYSLTGMNHSIVTDQERADGWVEFEFDTNNYDYIVDADSVTFATAFELGKMARLWTDQGEAIFKNSESLVTKLLHNSNVRVCAKLLKVKIDRRYFTDALFTNANNRNLLMKSQRYVSPPPQAEFDFIETVTTQEYLMPEYITGFVLAKDIQLVFTGIDPSVVSELLDHIATSYDSGHYGPFSLKVSFSYEHIESYTQAVSTADGFLVKIPGAQVIGYTTKVLPPFPVMTADEETQQDEEKEPAVYEEEEITADEKEIEIVDEEHYLDEADTVAPRRESASTEK